MALCRHLTGTCAKLVGPGAFSREGTQQLQWPQVGPSPLRLFFHSFPPQWREERFRQTSESTNQRVLWWSILQTLILVAIGVWQMRHLKSFFEAKKLV